MHYVLLLLKVIDYAIARRIVDLHSGSMDDMERMYSPDEIQRYITFARQFKPQVSFSFMHDQFLYNVYNKTKHCLICLYENIHHADAGGDNLTCNIVCS